MESKIKDQKLKTKDQEIKILNLFGYTGGATLACAKAGALVTHVDASKTSINWGRENQELSGLIDLPIRWILDDALAFVKKEIKRGKLYDGILLDPPSFGHGPSGEMWKIEEGFLELIEDCKKLLSEKPLFLLLNGYSAGYSSIGYLNTISSLKSSFGGILEHGEMVLQESSEDKRLLPSGIFARWSRD
jgi:23S rRNA (cytosine1962-C5)-methyltransferase